MSIAIIFICHDNASIQSVVHYDHYIIVVGNNEIDEKYLNVPKIIIARNLKNNIEYEPKLLTFTAWYAITKNNLFLDCKYLCIFEYDVVIKDNFYSKIAQHFDVDTISNLSFNKNNFQFSFFSSKNIRANLIIDKPNTQKLL
jgi:hypothetical protein